VLQNANLFNFNQSFMNELENLHKECGYANYLEEYMVFPAKKQQPAIGPTVPVLGGKCDIFDLVINTALDPNPCFNPYEIPAMCPIPFDPLGFPTIIELEPAGFEPYFNRTDVKKALHAPLNVQWSECSANPFVADNGQGGPEAEGDLSADPIQKVLPQVIEATNRVLVANGDYDMIVLTDGTLLSVQNMTWNGKLGFQTQPSTPINIHMPDLLYTAAFDSNDDQGLDGPQGIMGIQHYERGLLWAETYQSGHMEPQYQPRVSYRHLQWLLGHVETL
jgi:carboxypeptidase D